MDGTISQYEQKSFEELRLEYYNKASNISGAPSGEREESTEALSNQQMNSMKVLDLISRARDEVRLMELLMHDANAIKTMMTSKMFPWIYNAHDGIVEKALKALEAIESVVVNTITCNW